VLIIKYYCKIVSSAQKTIEIKKEIDVIYPEVEKDIEEFGDERKLECYCHRLLHRFH